MSYGDTFRSALEQEIAANARNWHHGNWPSGDKGEEPAFHPYLRSLKHRIRHNGLSEAARRCYAHHLRPLARDLVLLAFPQWIYRRRARRFEDVAYLYDLLDDEASRSLLTKVIAYRVMGHWKVWLPRNSPLHDQLIAEVAALPTEGDPIKVRFMDLTLALRDFRSKGFDLKAYCTPAGGSYAFLQKQYEYHGADFVCKAEADDVVVDAGACWGETSLYFAHEVGPQGRVIAFEFIPSNLSVLRENISRNPGLAGRIVVVPNPVWNEDGRTLYYVDWGPGSRVSFQKIREDFEDTQCHTRTIDAVVQSLGLSRVDMIKMDIEGAELNALKGARQSIVRFQPKLAISLYHHIDDFSTIPRYIESLGVPYRYYLDHHTIYENETVLFAVPLRS